MGLMHGGDIMSVVAGTYFSKFVTLSNITLPIIFVNNNIILMCVSLLQIIPVRTVSVYWTTIGPEWHAS